MTTYRVSSILICTEFELNLGGAEPALGAFGAVTRSDTGLRRVAVTS